MASRVLEVRDTLRRLDAARKAIDEELAVIEEQLKPVGMKGPLVDGEGRSTCY